MTRMTRCCCPLHIRRCSSSKMRTRRLRMQRRSRWAAMYRRGISLSNAWHRMPMCASPVRSPTSCHMLSLTVAGLLTQSYGFQACVQDPGHGQQSQCTRLALIIPSVDFTSNSLLSCASHCKCRQHWRIQTLCRKAHRQLPRHKRCWWMSLCSSRPHAASQAGKMQCSTFLIQRSRMDQVAPACSSTAICASLTHRCTTHTTWSW